MPEPNDIKYGDDVENGEVCPMCRRGDEAERDNKRLRTAIVEHRRDKTLVPPERRDVGAADHTLWAHIDRSVSDA